MARPIFKIFRCLHKNISKVCLSIFQNYSCKTIHLRCLTGFWICLWRECWDFSCIKYHETCLYNLVMNFMKPHVYLASTKKLTNNVNYLINYYYTIWSKLQWIKIIKKMICSKKKWLDNTEILKRSNKFSDVIS